MGIGISYTGHDGRTRKFDSGEEARSFLDSLGTSAKRHTGNALREAMSRIPSPMNDQNGKPKLLPGGSVIDSPNGMCLRGEEQTPLIEGVKLFASVNGSKGFKKIDEIDSPGSAPICGPMFGCDSEDEDSAEAGNGEPVRIPFVSRTKMVVGEVTTTTLEEQEVEYQDIILYEFIREMVFSPSGRRVFCTKERRRMVGQFRVYKGGGGSSDGKYGVRLFSVAQDETDPVHPTPDAFAFGTEANLDTYNKDSGQFECNYEGGQVKDDPPVKVIAVTICPGGIPGGD